MKDLNEILAKSLLDLSNENEIKVKHDNSNESSNLGYTEHKLHGITVIVPTNCSHCNEFIITMKQGYRCDCKLKFE